MVSDAEAATITPEEMEAAQEAAKKQEAQNKAHEVAVVRFMRREMQKDDTNFAQSRNACEQGYSPDPVNPVLTQEEQCTIVNSDKMERLHKQYQKGRDKKIQDIRCKGDEHLCDAPSHGLPADTQKKTPEINISH